jgi:hypothetical protein
MCTEGILKDIELIKSTSEKVESLFNKIELNDDPAHITFNETYTLKYLDAEFTYVFPNNGNIYLFVEKGGNLIGAINYYDGGTSIIFPKDILPELICVMICFLVWGQSAISIIACPLVPLAIILYPYDQELHEALTRACLNGFVGLLYPIPYVDRFCY